MDCEYDKTNIVYFLLHFKPHLINNETIRDSRMMVHVAKTNKKFNIEGVIEHRFTSECRLLCLSDNFDRLLEHEF